MDNLTHTLIGASLGKAGLGRSTAMAAPTLLVAANLPDIDNFTGRLFSSLEYFDYHRGWPHSLAGVTILSAGLAGAVWAFARWKLSEPAERPGFGALYALGLIGALSHIAMDLTNDYGLRPFLPFSGRWYYGDLIGIVDPWIWLIFGCALFAAARSKKGRALWIGFGAVVVFLFSLIEGAASGIVWGITAVAAASAATLLQHRRGIRPARLAFAGFAVYLLGVTVSHSWTVAQAWKDGEAIAGTPISRVGVLPRRAGNPGGVPVILESADAYFVGDATGILPALAPGSFQHYPKNLEDPLYWESLRNPRMAALARFARFPSVRVESSGGAHTVTLRDLRYSRRESSDFGAAVVRLPKQ